MAEIALKHDKPIPEGLKTGSEVVLRGKLQVDPVKLDIFQIPQGIALHGDVIASERDDLGHQRLKVKTRAEQKVPAKIAYFWIYNDKLFNGDPFEKVIYKNLNKRQILSHYRTVWPALRKEIIGHQLTVVLFWGGALKQTRLWPYTGNKTFEIANWHDLEQVIYFHGIELIPDLELKSEYGKLRRCVIDVDSKAPLEDTKHVVVEIYRRLLEIKPKDWGIKIRDSEGHVDPKGRFRPYIVSTGSKAGFHVRFDLDEAYPAMELKTMIEKDVLLKVWETSDVVRQFCLDPHRRMYPKDPAIRSGKIFLDLSPMKARGGIKAIGSINAKTLAIVQRVPLNQLADFMPKPDAVK